MKQIVRRQWIAVVLVISLNSAHVYSQSLVHDISEFELNNLVTNLNDEIIKLDTQSMVEIEQYLNSFQPLEKTVVTHLWLNELSYQQNISEQHLVWVRSLVNSNAKLLSRSSDHPQKPIALVNIAEQARSVLKINQIKHLVGKIEQQWQADELVWEDWLTGDAELTAALANWLTMQDQDIDLIKQSFVANSNPEQWRSNQILAILLEKSPSEELFSLLWQRNVDEYTYQAIYKLPNGFDSELVVNQLIVAMKIKQLTSQALLSLATHYSQNEKAQVAIETSLGKPDEQWYALMALDKMNAPEFKQNLLFKLQQGQSRFAESATKMIANQLAEAELKERK